MNADKQRVIEALLSTANTNSLGDSMVQAEVIRLYRAIGDAEAVTYATVRILEKRAAWLKWYQYTQNYWQNKSRDKHHDSFEIREKYVAPHVTGENEFQHRASIYNRKRLHL